MDPWRTQKTIPLGDMLGTKFGGTVVLYLCNTQMWKKRLRSNSDQAGGKGIFVLEFITKDQIDGSYMILCRAVLQIVHVLYKETSEST